MSGLFEAAHADARRETLLDNAAHHRQRRAAQAARGGAGSRAARTLRLLADRLETPPAVRHPAPQPVRTGPGARG